jgi:hypothetical protein
VNRKNFVCMCKSGIGIRDRRERAALDIFFCNIPRSIYLDEAIHWKYTAFYVKDSFRKKETKA